MSSSENLRHRLHRIIIQAKLKDDDNLIYVFNPRRLYVYKLSVKEWRKEGRASKAFDRFMLATQLMMGAIEIAVIPEGIKVLLSPTNYRWFFVLLLLFCAYFGPKQFINGTASVRWLIRHSKKVTPSDRYGGW